MHTIELTLAERAFVAAYFEAVQFTETGDDGQPETGAELCEQFERDSAIDCLAFLRKFGCYLADLSADEREIVAYNFWLTRNGHGVGFWDREGRLEFLAEWLTDSMDVYSKRTVEAYAEFEEQSDND